ncbi:hypothetical protein DUNSADRAFT_17780 [Dunaliella salina]|uniref:Uncharacterized protein n=1 Tax=Dunaliella salina TaxID=3046 RepID=A0ABQ7G133_DUNSA|nr:hypothetical protein DUNSADRAFT_17780 [Dunaliella salina]|eukprot:KAF5828324.1 hypothetical protein DUNSADRAFT_17780 [Dunaliella salina]
MTQNGFDLSELYAWEREIRCKIQKQEIVCKEAECQIWQLRASNLRSHLNEASARAQKAQEELFQAHAEWLWGPHGPREEKPTLNLLKYLCLMLASPGQLQSFLARVEEHGSLLRKPVTLALVVTQAFSFQVQGILPLRELYLSPYCVLDKAQWTRLLTPAFIHKDAPHLLDNLKTSLPDCLELEASGGSVK